MAAPLADRLREAEAKRAALLDEAASIVANDAGRYLYDSELA